ncbi:MAG TPA: Flp family type IVb pilin [Stellaceae bacterium]|nr:Flp family type IVb pilin [Stellaceae bacterium]
MSCYLALFRGDRSGAVAIEYVLIAALIGLAIIAGATTLGQSLNTFYTNAGNALPGA